MTAPAFHALLDAFRDLHAKEPALQEFCAFPQQIAEQPITARHLPPADLMTGDRNLTTTDACAPMRDAFIAASPHAFWRETYKGTRLGADFMNRFACYCLMGQGGPFTAPEMQAYVVYMPAGLYYPFHHHPAEELYYILAGQAEFMLEGRASKTVTAGDAIFHPSNAPHATETHDHPVMALVLWRNNFETAPVLTYPDGTL